MMKIRRLSVIFMLALLVFSACKDERTTKLLYQGHASFRLTAKNGTVIYIDPAYGEGYDLPADIILVTHGHSDHNRVNLVTQKEGCTVITNDEAQKDKKYNSFKVKGINIESVEAYNASHHRSIGVGYIITVDGIKLYHTGDSAKTDQMETLPGKKLDYALVYIGGVPEMAAEWAKIIGAANSIPIHTSPPGILFDRKIAERFSVPNRLIVEPKEEIELRH
jgi:L-ascorbate metabolism protein UlaG (beta-lactamase superfamily)